MSKKLPNPGLTPVFPPSAGGTALLTDTLTDTDTSTVLTRPGGLYEASVVINVTAFSATTASFILEGSNDGTNYHQIDRLVVTATGTYSIGNQGVVLPRWKYIRVRSAPSGGAATLTAAISINGLYNGVNTFVQTQTATYTGATVNTDAVPRYMGALLMTVQVVSASVTGSGDAVLQGSADGSVWEDVATATISGNGSVVFTEGSDASVSMGGYAFFRVRFASGLTAGTATVYWGFDGNDANRSDSVADSGGTPPLNSTMLKVSMSAAAEAGDARVLTITFTNFDGSQLDRAINFEAVLSDTSLAGAVDLAATAVFAASATTGTLVAGGTTNRIVGTTDSTGVFVISVGDTATETVYAAVLPGGPPNTTPVMIVQNPQLAMAFA